eukprot:4632430-Pyramimonas_sp.AAC.1
MGADTERCRGSLQSDNVLTKSEDAEWGSGTAPMEATAPVGASASETSLGSSTSQQALGGPVAHSSSNQCRMWGTNEYI